MRTFEYSEGASNKFWNVKLSGRSFTVNYGKIGAAGQTQTKTFADEAAARKEHDKLVAEKLRKGYKETTHGAAPAAPAPAKAEKPAPEEPVVAIVSGQHEHLTWSEPAGKQPPSPAAQAEGERTFEYSDASSHKFWNVRRDGARLRISYGRVGGAGQTQLKTLPDEAAAVRESDRLVAEKLKKGYRETTPSARKAPSNQREALEAALAEDPDDLASHMAFADYLSDQGDPLGEFVRVQLALEDEARPSTERKKLEKQQKKLLDAHAHAWLGELAPFLLDVDESVAEYDRMTVEYAFRRGWLHSLTARNFTLAFTRALARAPQVRLLRDLHLDNNNSEDQENEPGDGVPEDVDPEVSQLFPLVRCPHLGNVRRLVFGDLSFDQCHTHGPGLAGVIKLMPKLEELFLLAHDVDVEQIFSLRTLDNLRVLMVYHATRYPLARLAKNPSMGKLTHLLCHPHALTPDDDEPYLREPAVKALVNSPELKSLTHLQLRVSDMGDKGIKTIAASGVLKRLETLDLQHGCVTDQGARTLAACADLKKLRKLDLTNNCLTEEGVALLKAAGVAEVKTERQWQPRGDEYRDTEYLYEGDIE